MIRLSSNDAKIAYAEDSITITLLTMSKVFVYYLYNILFPINLCASYEVVLAHSLFELPVLFSLAIIIFLFMIPIRLYKKSREIFWGIFYFFLTLLPVSNIIPTGHFMNDRYLYMPLLGFCIVFSYLLIKLFQNKTILIVTFLIVLIFYSSLTIKQNIIWQDEMRLWENVIKRFPNLYIPYYQYGLIYSHRGLLDKAISNYSKGLQLNPTHAEGYYNRGIAYYKKGLLDKAISDYNKALRLNPMCVEAYNNRGVAYYEKKIYNKAIKDFKKAAELGNNSAIENLKKCFYRDTFKD